MNETKDEEPSVPDNSIINAPSYFKIYDFGKTFLNNLDGTYGEACMATSQDNQDVAVLRYGLACMLEKKEKYLTELSNNITTFNDKKIRHYPI